MTLRLQIIMTVILLIAFFSILNMVRKRKLELKYALVWFIVIIGLTILLWVHGMLEKMSEILGIYSPVNMIFLLGFLFALVIIFVLTVTVSRMSIRLRRLAQIVAIQNKNCGEKEPDTDEKIQRNN